MRIIGLIAALLISGAVSAQVGINAGGSVLKSFGVPRPWAGIHVGVEVPRDDAVSIYGRVTHHFKQYNQDSIYSYAIARDLTTSPQSLLVSGNSSMNYTILEGGTRYYLGNGYDYGWAAYGGSELMLMFNTIKTEFRDFDQVLYELPAGSEGKGAILSFAFGLNGGVKYTMAGVGSFYFDAGLAYIILAQPSNDLASQHADLFRPLLFNFNLGFRKEILW